MSGIVGSKDNIRGSGLVAKLGTDGQIMTSAGAGKSAVFEDASAGGTSWQSVVTASTLTAVAGNGYPINTTSNACTVTLPGSASVGDTIEFTDYARNFATNALTLNPNSLNFQGNSSPNPSYATAGQHITIVYHDATKGWIPTVDDEVTLETPQAYNADWLCIAGGGGGGIGGAGGGGGAGGYRGSYGTEPSGGGESSEPVLSLTPGTSYTITVGGGAAAHEVATPATASPEGSTSSIAGSDITDITCAGGGGGFPDTSPAVSSMSGGSGAGADGGTTYQQFGEGTAEQGYDGGAGQSNGWAGGGGGGAGGEGGDASGSTQPAIAGNGGAGLDGDITGSEVGRGGGGGGGDYLAPGPASTATHGGAAGGMQANGADATANTGGGGGGGGGVSPNRDGGAGGSGVVILRMPTANYSGTNENGTVTTSGTDTIITFNSTGSIQG